MEDYLMVGVIANTHGVRGEVKVYPTTDDVNRFKKLKEIYMGDEKAPLHIQSVKFQKNMVILGFKEYTSLNEVEGLRNKELFVDRAHAVKLQKDEYFISDLIGMKVVTDEGAEFGELTDVMTTGANDVYVVKTTDGKEVLLPAIKECVLKVDMNERVMSVHIMEGLL
ncbi:MAG: ribosome maturation factor RimM [Lachnospiraceae bacterium]|nr:ribosome maturation factor RimM [Lachnospiraceae bacterium]